MGTVDHGQILDRRGAIWPSAAGEFLGMAVQCLSDLFCPKMV